MYIHNVFLNLDYCYISAFLKKDLDEYVLTLPIPTKVLRLTTRQGLVAARLLGAKYASGEVYIFIKISGNIVFKFNCTSDTEFP